MRIRSIEGAWVAFGSDQPRLVDGDRRTSASPAARGIESAADIPGTVFRSDGLRLGKRHYSSIGNIDRACHGYRGGASGSCHARRSNNKKCSYPSEL
jgi:hypothetical protein